MLEKTVRTEACEIFGIEHPVILAGMGALGRATPPPLVAAVSNAGGLGVFSGSGLSPEEVRHRIHLVRGLTDKPFGVDLLLPAIMADVEETRTQVRNTLREQYPKHVAFVEELGRQYGLPEGQYEDETVQSHSKIRRQVEVCLEEKVPVFAAALGDPAWMVPQAHQQGIIVMGLVGSVRNALRQVRAGVDIIIAQGHEAGGHTGRIANFALIPAVIDAVKPRPVVAAGGIADGRGMAAALALGAIAVWVGTAFLVAEECEIYDEFKDQIIAANAQDTEVTRCYTGKTARDIRNPVIAAWEKADMDPLPMPLQWVLMEDFAERARKAGRFDLVNNPAGQIVGIIKKRKPAKQILEEMVAEAVDILEGLHTKVTLVNK